jgi:3-oxoacyl-[acyl-carrier protein] reductase
MATASLADKVALVTGASGHLGSAIAEELARLGARVAIASRSLEKLQSLAQRIHGAHGAVAHPFSCDLKQPQAAATLLEAVVARFGRLDILVNCAGSFKRGDLLSLANDDWLDGFNLMFFGAVRVTAAAWPQLARNRGHVVTISGIHGIAPHAFSMLGGTICAALINFSKSLAELGLRDGVYVNTVVPGWIESERLAVRVATLAKEQGTTPEQMKEQMRLALGIMRYGKPADVANTVAFLVTGAYAHGTSLIIDGGMNKSV